MAGETELKVLLKSLNPVLREGEFVFCTLPRERAVELDIDPVCQFVEDEGLSVILPRIQADNAGLTYDYISRMIKLSVHSSLSAVCLMAAVTTLLAGHGISVNPVSAYFHDYLFVPADRAKEAMSLLAQLSQ